MSADLVNAPIVAVTVFPDRARVTRRGAVRLAPGEHRVQLGPLPLGLLHDSVRVSGQGPATVAGVNVITRREPVTVDASVAILEAELRDLEAELGALLDADTVAQQRERFLGRLAMRKAGALATGDAAEVGQFADSLDEQLIAVHQARRERARERADLIRQQEAAQRRLADLRSSSTPDRLVAEILLEVESDEHGDGGCEIELELSYMIPGASWSSSYDLRLADERLKLTWHGLIRQHTGEDWPECALKLSTARPAGALSVPELDPWYVGVHHPAPPLTSYGMVGGAPGMPPAPAAPQAAMAKVSRAAAVRDSVAVVQEGPVAATYTPQRPVAVPADGTSHRTLIATFELAARLDHVTAPVLAQEATLRATVRNTSAHTLPAGTAALFHDGDFVGSTHVEPWAPEEERELALGVDDRVRVERELVRRSATKATIGSTRRTDAEYKITVTNHGSRPISVTVLDQLPVSRDAQITVKELSAKPEPAERSDLGILTWKFSLNPGAGTELHFVLRVEAPKTVDLAGWRD